MKKLIFSLYSAFLLAPTLVYAGGETPVGDGFSYFIDAMLGETGIALATLAVIVVGLLCLAHILKLIHLFYTIMGICIMFGSKTLVLKLISLIHH